MSWPLSIVIFAGVMLTVTNSIRTAFNFPFVTPTPMHRVHHDALHTIYFITAGLYSKPHLYYKVGRMMMNIRRLIPDDLEHTAMDLGICQTELRIRRRGSRLSYGPSSPDE
ncbi:hypothetical protein PILCRDRAFT_700625 [Piloderma croceum F 1598]|uniref:Uncharacterized protein n=1 Tax=Piloderma croceum (strain F 1598) TaxID=765440 RepID=A0A0C3F3P7_PILCF|nr:hypothetical protein PILCRDRAFT_700625 [Piloderma croceum F 1598]